MDDENKDKFNEELERAKKEFERGFNSENITPKVPPVIKDNDNEDKDKDKDKDTIDIARGEENLDKNLDKKDSISKKHILLGFVGFLVVGLCGYIAGTSNGTNSVVSIKNEASKIEGQNGIEVPRINISNGTGTNVTNNKREGRVLGNDVLIRTGPGTNYDIITDLNDNTYLEILDSRTSANSNGAILGTTLYYWHNGNKIELPKGMAVNIISDNGNKYYVSFVLVNRDVVKDYIEKRYIDRIGNDVWYKVRLNSGIEGYIFGKFVRKL